MKLIISVIFCLLSISVFAMPNEMVSLKPYEGTVIDFKATSGPSIIIISNESRANIVEFAITGAPSTGLEIKMGTKILPVLNSFISLPPNSPSTRLIASGDFGGAKISITNITNSTTPAVAKIVIINK